LSWRRGPYYYCYYYHHHYYYYYYYHYYYYYYYYYYDYTTTRPLPARILLGGLPSSYKECALARVCVCRM